MNLYPIQVDYYVNYPGVIKRGPSQTFKLGMDIEWPLPASFTGGFQYEGEYYMVLESYESYFIGII